MADTAQWSQLPRDLLQFISKRIYTFVDILSLRSVCSSWRSSIPPFTKNLPLPLNLPFPVAPSAALNPLRRGHFSLNESTIYILQNANSNTSNSAASRCWLIRIEETRQGKLRALNPLSRILTEKTPIDFPKSLNLLDSRIIEIGHAYSLDFVETSNIIETEFGALKPILIVSSDPWPTDSDDYAVMVIHGGKLAFINLRDKIWTLLDDPKQCDDVVYHKGKFYSVDHKGRTVVIGSDLEAKEITNQFSGYGGGQFKCLVKSYDDNLYLIDKSIGSEGVTYTIESKSIRSEELIYTIDYFDSEVSLRVFKLNEEDKRWDLVDSLGDQVFFLGDDCSFAVRSQAFQGLKGNCIYFSEDLFNCQNEELGEFCVDTGLYRMEDGKCGPLSDFPQRSLILWPPPSWLRSKSHGTSTSK